MNYDKFHIQTLAGMSLGSLKAHHRQVKEEYMQTASKDTRTQAYLSTVNGFIQRLENEGEK